MTVTVVVAWIGIGVPIWATGWGWNGPTMRTAKMLTMNTSVGSIRNRADSVIPTRLIAVSSTSPTRQIASRSCASPGNTLARLAAPAARLTATVRM